MQELGVRTEQQLAVQLRGSDSLPKVEKDRVRAENNKVRKFSLFFKSKLAALESGCVLT
jgi:hypothetical protein